MDPDPVYLNPDPENLNPDPENLNPDSVNLNPDSVNLNPDPELWLEMTKYSFFFPSNKHEFMNFKIKVHIF